MRVTSSVRLTLFLLVSASSALAYPALMPGSENIPQMMADATLVCKGEVTGAPLPVLRNDGSRFDVTATVRMDRCYKGRAATAEVLFDGVWTNSGPGFVLTIGDYDLFFLKPQKRNYARVDQSFGVLPVSKLFDPNSSATEPLLKLEEDLKAGLQDKNPELVYDNIEILGNMRPLRSTAELKRVLDATDDLKNTYVWEALIKLKDYSDMQRIADFFSTHQVPPRSQPLFLPRDRVLYMETRIFTQIGAIRDPVLLSYLHQFAGSQDELLRLNAVTALRAIKSLTSAGVLLKELDDSNPDTAIQALHALVDIAGGDWPTWFPNYVQFREARAMYSEKAREWWRSEGQQRAISSCHCESSSIDLKDKLE